MALLAGASPALAFSDSAPFILFSTTKYVRPLSSSSGLNHPSERLDRLSNHLFKNLSS
jgi:hypothetical protein